MPAAPRLAIVVPAWKPQFLDEALRSIAAQSCPDFDCFIFDDAGPPEVAAIAGRYPQFRYHRFDENFGSHSLVTHWNRCLLTLAHEWVWLFSDDDVMSPGSVQAIRNALSAGPRAPVLQLSVELVGESLQPLNWASTPPAHESASAFLKARLRGERLSCLPDHVFSWHRLRREVGGIVDLPLAWNADDATWLLLGAHDGLDGVPDAKVWWRQSQSSISGGNSARWLKLDADLRFLDLVDKASLADDEARDCMRQWLSRRLVDVYGFDWGDFGFLWKRLPQRWRQVLPGAFARAGRKRLRGVVNSKRVGSSGDRQAVQ